MKRLSMILLTILFVLCACGTSTTHTVTNYPSDHDHSVTYGYMDMQGILVIDKQYTIDFFTEEKPHFHDGLAYFINDGQYGFINKNNKVVIKPAYEDVRNFSNGIAWVMLNEKWGTIDTVGNFITQPKYDDIKFTDADYVGVCIDSKWGYADKEGQLLIEPEYDNVKPFYNGYAFVNIGSNGEKLFGLWGCINQAGERLVEPQYDLYSASSPEELNIVRKEIDGELFYGYIDYKGNLVIDYQYEKCFNFSEGLARVSTQSGSDALYGFINTSGEMVIEEAFKFGWEPFSEGLASVTFPDGTDAYINRNGETVIRFEEKVSSTRFSEGLASVQFGELYGYIDKTGEIAIEPMYDEAYDFKNGLAYVSSKDKKGFIDRDNNLIISMPEGCSLLDGDTFHEGLLLVQ